VTRLDGRLAAFAAAAALALALVACGGGQGHTQATSATEVAGPAGTAPTVGGPSSTNSPNSTDLPGATEPTGSSTTVGGGAPGTGGSIAAVAGHTIVIDPGHNGGNGAHASQINAQVFVGNGSKECDTTGTSGNDGYPEHAFTYDVATRLQALLAGAGADVVLTRPDDIGWGPCITQRASIGNDAKAELGISIHADGGPTSGTGFHVIKPLPVAGYNDGIVPSSDRFGTILRDSFRAETTMPTANYIATDGLISRSDLGGLNMSHVPKVFIECGNMRNAGDEAKLHDPAWRQKAAQAIAEAMAAYFASK